MVGKTRLDGIFGCAVRLCLGDSGSDEGASGPFRNLGRLRDRQSPDVLEDGVNLDAEDQRKSLGETVEIPGRQGGAQRRQRIAEQVYPMPAHEAGFFAQGSILGVRPLFQRQSQGCFERRLELGNPGQGLFKQIEDTCLRILRLPFPRQDRTKGFINYGMDQGHFAREIPVGGCARNFRSFCDLAHRWGQARLHELAGGFQHQFACAGPWPAFGKFFCFG